MTWCRGSPERLLTLVPAPDGGKHRYYQKAAPTYAPTGSRPCGSAPSAGRDVDYVVCQDAPRCDGQQLAMDHPAPVRRDRLDRPDLLVVDVDRPRTAFEAAVEVVFLVLDPRSGARRQRIKATGAARTARRVPIERRVDQGASGAAAITDIAIERRPDLVTDAFRKAKREDA